MPRDILEERVDILEDRVAKLVEFANADIQYMRTWRVRNIADQTMLQGSKDQAERETIE